MVLKYKLMHTKKGALICIFVHPFLMINGYY